jgi:DNA processing protein
MKKNQLPEPKCISSGDSAYPERLRTIFGELLPPDLWVMGNFELMYSKGVGFCGSRNASDAGLIVAADCAKQLSEHKLTIISGYASGVDMASHEAALSCGGTTIIILPEGIDHFRIKKTIKDIWDWNRVAVISYFPRNAVWRADRAMERNKAIVSLSDAVIVLEAGDRGGTLNAGFRALEMRKPLFVAFFENMADGREGNKQLIERGGVPLQRNRTTGKANLKSIYASIGSVPESIGFSA